MKTAEEIIDQMRIEMPFHLPERINPYIKEAMQIYAIEACKEALKNAAENAKLQAMEYQLKTFSGTIDKKSITNESNIPELC